MSLGIGLTVTNTKAVWEALIGKQTAFARTPKYRVEIKGQQSKAAIELAVEIINAPHPGLERVVYAVRPHLDRLVEGQPADPLAPPIRVEATSWMCETPMLIVATRLMSTSTPVTLNPASAKAVPSGRPT
jgi:hypothetical protein